MKLSKRMWHWHGNVLLFPENTLDNNKKQMRSSNNFIYLESYSRTMQNYNINR